MAKGHLATIDGGRADRAGWSRLSSRASPTGPRGAVESLIAPPPSGATPVPEIIIIITIEKGEDADKWIMHK